MRLRHWTALAVGRFTSKPEKDPAWTHARQPGRAQPPRPRASAQFSRGRPQAARKQAGPRTAPTSGTLWREGSPAAGEGTRPAGAGGRSGLEKRWDLNQAPPATGKGEKRWRRPNYHRSGRRAIPGGLGSGPGGDAGGAQGRVPVPVPGSGGTLSTAPAAALHPRRPQRSPRPALPRRLARTMPFFCSTNVDPFTRLDTTATPRPSDTAAGLGLRAPSPAAAAAAAAVPIPPAPALRACARAPPAWGRGRESKGGLGGGVGRARGAAGAGPGGLWFCLPGPQEWEWREDRGDSGQGDLRVVTNRLRL